MYYGPPWMCPEACRANTCHGPRAIPRGSTTCMIKRLWPPFLAVLIYIVALIALSGTGLVRTTNRITAEVTATQQRYRRVDDTLEDVRRSLLTVAVRLRDALILGEPGITTEIAAQQRLIRQRIAALRSDLSTAHNTELLRIETELDTYFARVQHMLNESPTAFRSELYNAAGKRRSLLHLVEQLNSLNEHDFESRQNDAQESLHKLRREIIETIAMAIALSLAAAAAALTRVADLEKRNRAAHLHTAEARAKLESLSRQLVSAQENERKSLSRELHDEIGQSLTALKLELAKCERLARSEGSQTVDHIRITREIADQTLRATRSISLGLRPPMLDDLGLAAALSWFTREFSSRSGIQVHLDVEGDIAELPEHYRTCVYRIVQESLTNCARHAHARNVTVRIDADRITLAILIRDDGTGFNPTAEGASGLGLLSMRERASELGGTFEVVSHPGNGSTIYSRIPCPLMPSIKQ